MVGYNVCKRVHGRAHWTRIALWIAAVHMMISFFVCLLTHAVYVAVDPSLPLLNVPFRVSAEFLQQGQNLFLSLNSACEMEQLVDALCTLPANRTCEFNVTSMSMGVSPHYDKNVPPLYICSTAFSQGYIQSLQLHVIDVTPRFVVVERSCTVTVGDATPVGSIFGFFSDEGCTGFIENMPITILRIHRTLNLIAADVGVIHLCARIPYGDDGIFTSYIPAATLLTVSPFTVSDTKALRYTTQLFKLDSFSQIPFASFSLSPICLHLLQEPVGGIKLQNIILPILVPKGDYYLCTGLPYYKNLRVYVPSSNLITVQEYGLQPHTMYTGLLTTMELTLDAASLENNATVATALFFAPGCKKDPVIPWSTSRTWTVTLPGLYYACVAVTDSHGSNMALAANITVLNAPIVLVSQSPAIRGIDMLVTLTNRAESVPGVITVGLSLKSNCLQLVSRAATTETGYQATLRVPEDALETIYLCVSTPLLQTGGTVEENIDYGYTYIIESITTQFYSVSYDTLFVGKKGDVILDSDVQFEAGTKGMFAKDTTCESMVGAEFSMNKTVLKDVLFTDIGEYSLCIKLLYASAYARVATVVVYGAVQLAPTSVVVGTLTNVSVSLVPPYSPVKIKTKKDCSFASVAEGLADVNGEVQLQVLYTRQTDLTVCVGYGGNKGDGVWNIIPVGELPIREVHVAPMAVIVSKINRVNFVVPDATSLTGFQAFIVRGAEASCQSPSTGSVLPVNVPNRGRPFILFTPPEAAVWEVCLGNEFSTFRSIGTVFSVVPLEMTANPPSGAAGLPVNMKFGGPSWSALKPSLFFLTDNVKSCAFPNDEEVLILGEGSINAANGVAEPFVVTRADTLTVCVGWEDDVQNFFVYGGIIVIVPFRSFSRYAIRERTNIILAFPVLDDGSLFLVPCPSPSMCGVPISVTVCLQATERYYTSPLVPLKGAAAGRYVLCQEEVNGKGIVASTVPIFVVDPFLVNIYDTMVRQYRAARIGLSGGDVETRSEPITVFTMPPELHCNETDARSEEFIFAAGVFSGNITVTRITPFMEGVQLCVKASPKDIFHAEFFDILSYMTPATVITDRSTYVLSGFWKENVVAKLTALPDCAGSVMSVPPALITNYISELRVDGCEGGNADLNTVHYCESLDGGRNFVYRGAMALVRLRSCDADHPSAIEPITVPPGRFITKYGIDRIRFKFFMLSKKPDCQNAPIGRNLFLPQYDEKLFFFVCVSVRNDPDYVFTTDSPTLQVDNFKASPTSVPSKLAGSIGAKMRVEISLNYYTGERMTYLSDSASCDNVLASLRSLAVNPARALLLLVGVSGMSYVCVTPHGDARRKVAVAEILVVNPPIPSMMDPILVLGAAFHATLQVATESGQAQLYSLIPQEDVQYAFASFYTTFFRGIFFSIDACRSIVNGSNVVYVWDSGRVALPTKDIQEGTKFLSLCAGTPAGNLPVVTDIQISTAVIYPTRFVLGADADVFIPLTPNGVFHLRQDDNCRGAEVVPSFTTNSEGRGRLLFRRVSGEGLPSAGRWTLCVEDTGHNDVPPFEQKGMALTDPGVPLQPLTTIEAFNPVYYNVRGTDIIVGVSSILYLLDDLKVTELLRGFSMDRSCKEQVESYGFWEPLQASTDRGIGRIIVYAGEPAPALYLCATVSVNRSIVALPRKGAFRFLTPIFALPSIVPRCEPVQLGTCASLDSSWSGKFFTVILGDCCSFADRLNIVGVIERGSRNMCTLRMDPKMLDDDPPQTEYSVCAWDSQDTSYCSSLGRVKVSIDPCSAEISTTGSPMSEELLILIIVLSVLVGVLLIIFLMCVAIRFFRTKERKKREVVLAYPQLLGQELNPLTIYSSPTVSPLPMHEEQSLGAENRDRFTASSQTPISVGTSVDRAMAQSPVGAGLRGVTLINVWESMESDERDQVALQEARDRYNFRRAFTEGIERMCLEEKEQAVPFELSSEWGNPLETGDENTSTSFRRASAPREKDAEAWMESTGGQMMESEEEAGAAAADESTIAASFPPHDRTCVVQNHRSVSYTTMQRFHDKCRYLFEGETVRRQRITNMADEEWHDIVDAEFNSYVLLQKKISRGRLPEPLPDTTVMPSAVVVDHQTETESSNRHYDFYCTDEEDVYDAPTFPAAPLNDGNSGEVTFTYRSDTQNMTNAPTECDTHVVDVAENVRQSGELILEDSTSSETKKKKKPKAR
ncbi:hypothetical protein MOQ_008233 [Trypanosoma cruzi marinkellei]|uniref:Uncharacterized protein n=1 Tax=Trypanosoma cruzi marinkellei TaxID=85056 RepID=K2N0B2_TRYCR|nr:hypothetical protein MOQ_008233 [Trypanosoma cruzi marinkellei]